MIQAIAPNTPNQKVTVHFPSVEMRRYKSISRPTMTRVPNTRVGPMETVRDFVSSPSFQVPIWAVIVFCSLNSFQVG